jgi:hypothetical protein
MYQHLNTAIVLTAVFVLAIALTPADVSAQDDPVYQMYETMYVSPAPGHADMLSESMTKHNQQFHAEGPYAAYVFFIVNGPRTGDLFWAMGPATFTDLDSRPSGDPHDSDWSNNVLKHSEDAYNAEYWVLNEELSYTPESDGETRPVSRVRFFEVADDDLFVKVQSQIKATVEAMGGDAPRVMYRKRFLSRDKRDWAIVSSYKTWSALDEQGPDFVETFKSVHGEAAWDTFDAEFDDAVVSREDEWREFLPELSAVPTTDN